MYNFIYFNVCSPQWFRIINQIKFRISLIWSFMGFHGFLAWEIQCSDNVLNDLNEKHQLFTCPIFNFTRHNWEDCNECKKNWFLILLLEQFFLEILSLSGDSIFPRNSFSVCLKRWYLVCGKLRGGGYTAESQEQSPLQIQNSSSTFPFS